MYTGTDSSSQFYDDDGNPVKRHRGRDGCLRPNCPFAHPWQPDWKTARKTFNTNRQGAGPSPAVEPGGWRPRTWRSPSRNGRGKGSFYRPVSISPPRPLSRERGRSASRSPLFTDRRRSLSRSLSRDRGFVRRSRSRLARSPPRRPPSPRAAPRRPSPLARGAVADASFISDRSTDQLSRPFQRLSTADNVATQRQDAPKLSSAPQEAVAGPSQPPATAASPSDPRRRLSATKVLDLNSPPDRKSTRLNSSHSGESRMPSSA